MTSRKNTARLLIVEDDPEQCRAYAKVLCDYDLTFVPTATAALASLPTRMPDVILLDHILSNGERGTDFIHAFKSVAAHVPIVIISGTLEVSGQLAALQGPHRAHYVLAKPVSVSQLEDIVARALTDCGFAEAIALLQSIERAEKDDVTDPDRRFVERLARQHALLQLSRQDRTGRCNVSSLARQFHVDRRTIRRDLQDLLRRHQIDPTWLPEDELD
jgi:CheY-like chemotaxis protein